MIDRHVVATSAAHVFYCQRRAPTSRSAIGFTSGRNQSLSDGFPALTVGKPASANRIAWSRASCAPRHTHSTEPLTSRHLPFDRSLLGLFSPAWSRSLPPYLPVKDPQLSQPRTPSIDKCSEEPSRCSTTLVATHRNRRRSSRAPGLYP